jgi:ABC-type sulfate transport system permease component
MTKETKKALFYVFSSILGGIMGGLISILFVFYSTKGHMINGLVFLFIGVPSVMVGLILGLITCAIYYKLKKK